jgi:hypothetical protein
MNDELLHHPFDLGLKEITTKFSTVLRATVDTIDRHGLRQRHLTKHRSGIRRLFDGLTTMNCLSEPAERFRDRLLRYRNELFTFVQHDDVPWNNNAAENAIKQFAYYRKAVPNMMGEAGLKDYLTLLSIAQTCRFRGLNFQRFLMSRKHDIS